MNARPPEERIDLALRRSRSVDEEAAAERGEMMAARDALGNGAVGFGDHHLTVLVRETTPPRLDDAMASVRPHWRIPARLRCAKTPILNPRSGRSFRATRNLSCAAR